VKQSWIVRISLTATAAVLALSGCGSGPMTMTEKPAPPVVTPVQGDMQGGQQPIAGATLQLYAVGTNGYGSAATPLFSPAITTGSNGSFTFPSGYCSNASSPSSLVYLVGTGGMPAGAGTSITNNNVALMVVLGPCNGLNASTHIRMNELTTVAAVWALAPFMSGTTNAYLNIGSSSTNATGIQLAFEAAEEVVNTSSGSIGGTSLPAGATLPTQKLNTLADILGQCINSGGGGVTGGVSDGSNCGNLFVNAANTAGTVYPADTITAALNMAENAGRNVTSLFNLVPPTPVFETPLSSAPNDWTVAIQYTGGGLNAPTAIAADQSGDIWVTNGTATSGNYYVSEFNNLGSSMLSTTGTSVSTSAPTGLAIDLNGNAWFTVASANTLYELLSGGSLGGSPITGLNTPTSLAIDGNGVVWVVNNTGNSVSAFNSATNAQISGSPYSGGGIASPTGIAINGSANANCSDCN
jgi:hypothetical protein